MEQIIQYIKTSKIYPHKDNLRKKVGDVSELANSIKHSGILQNLTVVPRTSNTYTVVIGHRRLAAAKLAGLKEVPCSVAIMDYKEQLSTMLSENMQRNDLSLYEQACGIQIMLDVGESIQSIAEKTGFSSSTVRKRARLAELDGNLVKNASERGATLLDFEKLEKLRDPELKKRVLETMGTKNFEREWKMAKEKEERAEKRAAAEERLNEFAVKINNPDARLKYITYMGFGSEIRIPEDFKERKYYYTLSEYSATLYAEPSEADKLEESRKGEERAREFERKETLHEAEKRAFELRWDFVKQLNPKKQAAEVMRFAASAIGKKQNYAFEIKKENFDSLAGTEEGGFEKALRGELKISPEKTLLLMSYMAFSDSKENSYSDWNGGYKENKYLDILYTHLCALGYMLSDEEEQLKNGTHPKLVENAPQVSSKTED